MGFPIDPKMTLEELVASVKPGHDLTEEEFHFVLGRVQGRVKRCARAVWEAYDRPKRVKPEDLHSDGLHGWAQAWKVWRRDGGNYLALGSVIAERRMIDAIRQLVTRRVRRADGTWGRVLTEKSDYSERLSDAGGRLEAVQSEAAQRHSGEADFTDRIDARADFDAALGSEDPRDALVAMILGVADGRVFAVERRKDVEAIRKLLLRRGGEPRRVVQAFFPLVERFPDGTTALNRWWMSPDDIEKRLARVGRNILEKTGLDDAPSFLERAREAFEGERAIFSKELADKLGMSVGDLAEALKPYGVHSRPVQIDNERHRGYLLADLSVPTAGDSQKTAA